MDINHILERLENSPKDEITKTIDELAKFYGVSRQSVWREANKGGFRIRSTRSNKGATKVDEKTIYHIASLVYGSAKLNKKQTYTVRQIYDDLKKQGVEIPTGYERICSLLREYNIDGKTLLKPKPHVKLISLHPNHVHQFDISYCHQWYFSKDGKITEMDTVRTMYKNKFIQTAKKLSKRPNILRYVLIDHCSGAFFVHYYLANAERPEEGADFFYRAWADKRPLIEKTLGIAEYSGAYQFQGIPEILVSDQGSVLTNKVMRNLMDSLGVKIELHEAGNPRAKGMVEGLMRIIGNDFESKLRLYAINDIESLNRFALDWCISHNCQAAFRKAQTSRAQLWLKIKQQELRLCPEETIFKKLQHKREDTRVCNGDGEISYEGLTYTCIDPNAANKTVVVKMNAYEYPAIDIHFNGSVYKAIPHETDEFSRNISPNAVTYGTFKAPKKTEVEKNKDVFEEILSKEYGVTFNGKNDKRRAVPPAASALPEVALKKDDKVIYLQKQGVEITTPDIHAPLTDEQIIPLYRPKNIMKNVRRIPVIQMIRMYVDEIGKLTIEENKRLKAAFKDGVPADFTITDIDNFLHGEENTANKKFA